MGIAQLFHRIVHSGAGLVADPIQMVQHPGDRGDGDSRQPGNIFNRDGLRAALLPTHTFPTFCLTAIFFHYISQTPGCQPKAGKDLNGKISVFLRIIRESPPVTRRKISICKFFTNFGLIFCKNVSIDGYEKIWYSDLGQNKNDFTKKFYQFRTFMIG